MPITEEQRQHRKKFMGSSDAAAICGLDQYRNPADIYYDKTGQIEMVQNKKPIDVIDIGNYMERGVLEWFADKRKIKIITQDGGNNQRLHANGIMAANLDARVEDNPAEIVESKTHGVVSLRINEQWGEEGTDEVPERVALQCQHQMAVLPEVQIVWVPVLLGGVGLRYYRVERNPELIQNLEQIEVNFWKNHVEKKIAPPEIPNENTFKRLVRVPDKKVIIDNELVANWLAAKENAKQAGKLLDEAKLKILNALGDAEGGISGFGEFTYFLTKRKGYEVKETEFRQLNFKKSKEK